MKNYVVIINSEFGTDGEQICKNLAKTLNIKFYNQEILDMIATESNINKDICELIQKYNKLPNFLYLLYKGFCVNTQYFKRNFSLDEKISIAQNKVIKAIASKSPCIILGNCANPILKDKYNCINIFIFADKAYKCEKISLTKNISNKKANSMITSNENIEFNQNSYYYNEIWHDKYNYDLLINRSKSSIKEITKILSNYINSK